MRNNLNKLLIETLDELDVKYKYIEEKKHFQLLIDYPDNNQENVNKRLKVMIDINEKFGFVKLTLLLNGYAKKHEKLYENLNNINRLIEFGSLYSKLFLKDKNKVKVFYRHTIISRGSNRIFDLDEFQLLIAYFSFVQDIVNQELGEYVVDEDRRKV